MKPIAKLLIIGLALSAPSTGWADILRRPDEIPRPQTSIADTEPFEQPGPEMSLEATPVDLDPKGFGPDPVYEEGAYDPEAQYAIYGGKKNVKKVHPLIELGQPLYGEGPLNRSYNIIGSKNLVSPQFYVYGDWRNVFAYNNNGTTDLTQFATRLSLELDLKLTATERIHALLRPTEKKGKFTRAELAGTKTNGSGFESDLKPVTFFFEGDLGAITSGIKNDYVKWDLPFTFGLIPLFYQNGVWLDDAFVGAAFTIPSQNSKVLDITNMDLTFFVGTDKVTTNAIKKKDGTPDDSAARLYGVTTSIETLRGYLEAGYGFTDDTRSDKDLSYHNATLAFTKRYGGLISNSMRIITNWGQTPENNAAKTADGYVFIAENSLITHLPSTLIPYANFFYGKNRPQSLARGAGAGGVLKNVGLNFETDGITGFPKLDDTANDTYGGALGIEYLFGLNRQIVVELATVQTMGNDDRATKAAKGDQYALGLRYQVPLDEAWIFRVDAIAAKLDNASDPTGLRFELRRKF